MLNRRRFLKTTALFGAGMYAIPGRALNGYEKLTILHTNDMHCHLEPFQENDAKYPGRGGMNRIAAYVKQLRISNPDLLLLDSGDFSQGTPYYNFYKGEAVLKLMSEMGYVASTIGNHEFDNGLDSLKKVLQFANFPLISSNYDFSDTPLNGIIKKNIVLEVNGIRIGIYGLGIALQGLVVKELYGNTVYNDPLETALVQEEYLKEKEKCDFIICLSHLGYKSKTPIPSDIVLAENTLNTDVILGGHTHTFLESPVEVLNKKRQPVVINQVGWAALMLGELEFYFERKKKTNIDFSRNKHVG
jgi:5'-nucleotidase